MKIQENISLAPLTTFRVGGKARFFVDVESIQKLKEAVFYAEKNNLPIFILGGGSNILISDEGFDGLVIKISLDGIMWKEDGDFVFATVGAGVLWDVFVEHAVLKNLWGVENLSYIPGTVGAAPVQNIGAYGAEVKDVIFSVSAFDIVSKKIKVFTNSLCLFGYRNSFFKSQEGKKFIITDVTFKLSKKLNPNISYKDINEYFRDKSISNPSLLLIRNTVIAIRKKKLPDWHNIGTAGSFFKNPIIKKNHLLKLLINFPEMPSFEVDYNNVKIPLAWILDKVCGLKGYREGRVGLYENQPLALVNFDKAKANEIKNLAQKIYKIVKEKTNIKIEREVEYIGSI